MANGVHRHGRGWRATVSVTTRTFDTEQEAASALADLKARLAEIKAAVPAPAPPTPPRLDMRWTPSCDIPLLRALYGRPS
jgi:hypothetical protein